jgi:hypothetical protein
LGKLKSNPLNIFFQLGKLTTVKIIKGKFMPVYAKAQNFLFFEMKIDKNSFFFFLIVGESQKNLLEFT